MIVDFFRHGSGLSKGCLDYLLGEDREREHAQVLSGDVELTAQLIDSSPFAKKYTSGCLSFYEHDLSNEDKQKIMQNFEECLFPGLEKDQYQILWVQHQDKVNQDTGETRLELNFVIPNVELSTGKRLQPFYAPVDLDRVDLFKQITNTEHSLYDPDDPEHRQLFLNKKNLPKDIKDFKAQLHQRVYRAVANGEVADRQELVQWLELNQINVTRQVKNSISIENPYEGAKRPIRLEGEIYEQGFRATGEYRQEVQQRIEEYRGTASERYRANVTEYQRQLEHKSQYHSDRYPTVGRENSPEHSKQRPDGREAVEPVSSLAAIEIEPFNAIKRADTEPRTASPESSRTEKTYHFEYGTDFSSSYFAYSDFLAWSRHQKQVQRDADAKYRNQRETNEGRPFEQIGGQFDDQYLQATRQQSPAPMYSDQQESRRMAEWLHDSNGVLNDDRIRNTIIENHRRTTATITATTSAIAEATASFRHNANQDYPSLVSSIKSNRERSAELTASTEIIIDNTEAISRARTQYSELYRADQWQSSRDEPNYSELQGRTGENLNCTAFSLVTSSQSSAEFARNVRTIEANIVQMKERKKEMEQPQPKRDRGMNFGM
ncbi:TPA: relaxase/mobilization nuclease domain-containing protein [Acinetobacter baumannii]|nr:relaxase/mobilization nuclease domain-containing protein [Acinetobacter geminorum]MDA4983913.1 relaxase/mobilization nuclease domain-containing protein [Acinetobacter baumannii]HCA4906220.1 relaxase/mobilization nuclease domain-containing protein [Acinetobacter baumannii]HDI2493734.1 relaxase/mobilization nuclease domain-containing protein [Acinetobacter baumannii]HDI2513846.1 relaxase/mobilization nuclease domain-containing protein [Acinetobacter baumannii]HDI2526044.1 relaxase/mobilizatio